MNILRKLLGWPKPDIERLKAEVDVAGLVQVLDNEKYPFDFCVQARNALIEIVLSSYSKLSDDPYILAVRYAMKRMGDNYHVTETLPKLVSTSAERLVDALMAVYIDKSVEMRQIMGHLVPPDWLAVRYWRDVHALFVSIMKLAGDRGYSKLIDAAQTTLTDEKDKYWFSNATKIERDAWEKKSHG